MSDQSVADQGDPGDDETTKATPDQPGQPNVSQGSPRMVGSPMQLGELVTRAMAMGQGRPQGPLPQPQPVAPFDKLQQRFMQREAPYARPTGPLPPYMPGRVQTYVPSQPIRSFNEWGTPGEFPNTPQTWELNGMWSGIGQKLSQIGSGNVQKLTPFLGGGTDMKSYLAGQSAALKVQHERKVNAAWELDRVQEEELKSARDVYALFGGDVTSMTGADSKITLKDVGNFHDAMMNVARKANDTVLIAALDSGDYKRVENILKERDATSRDLKASLTTQRKDETRRENQQPFLEDGGPSQAGPPLGNVDAPEPPPVPSEETPPAEPGATPQPGPPQPSPDDTTRAAPNSEAPDFDPASTAPQAAAQPPRPVRLAQAGASDAPQPGVAQVQPQRAPPDTMGWQASPSVLNGATNEDGAKFKPGALEPFAQEAQNNPMFRPNAKQQYPGVDDARTSEWISRRQQQIDGELTRIEQDPRFDPQPNDTDQMRQRKRAAAYRAIQSVDPKFAVDIYHYVQGDMAVPGSQRWLGVRNHIIALGQKIDPTFNGDTFANRVRIKRDVTTGVDGRTMVGIATADSHVQRLIGLAEQLRQAQLSGGWSSPLTNRLYQQRGELPPNLGGDPRILDIVQQFKNEAALVAPEIARAQKGAAPTQGEINEHLGLLDPSLPVDTLIHNINNGRDLFHDRMGKLVTKFETLSGGKPDSAMMNWFHTFEQQGFHFDKPDDPTGVQGEPPPMLSSGTVSGYLHDFMTNKPGGGPITPPRGGMSQDDSDALNWARSNPNDPRARRILEHLGQ